MCKTIFFRYIIGYLYLPISGYGCLAILLKNFPKLPKNDLSFVHHAIPC